MMTLPPKSVVMRRYRSDGFLALCRSGFNFLRKQLKWRFLYHRRSIPKIGQVYWVNPDDINYIISWESLEENLGKIPFYDIQGGDWDLSKEEFENTYIYQSLVDHFRFGKPWKETEYFSIIEELMGKKDKEDNQDDILIAEISKNTNTIWNRDQFSTIEDPIEYLSYYDRIFSRIENERYRKEEGKIIVNIGRNGEYMRHDGAHRLAIAKILDINMVPIWVNLRHKKWQQIRDEVATSNSESDLPEDIRRHLNHPDLHDLMKNG